MTAPEPETKLWRLVVQRRRYLVLATDQATALSQARARWPAVDFANVVPVVNVQDNF